MYEARMEYFHRGSRTYYEALWGSSTFSTLSTAMGDSRLEYWDTTLLDKDLQDHSWSSMCSEANAGKFSM